MAREIIKIPPAKSLVFGLRSIGYNFSTALADIIDNSISAKAKNIKVFSNAEVKEPYVVIFDDGCGMNADSLENAMTIGSDRENKEDSDIELGRFGLGLKSASFSQCLKLIVASKQNEQINAMRYDLKKIEKTNEWRLDILNESEIKKIPEIEKLYDINSGTIVVWQQFDKIEHSSKSFKNSFITTIGVAKEHIELVFHRFYDEINIEFNHIRIEKRDPFLSLYPNTQIGRTQNIAVEGSKIIVTPFVLPYDSTLTLEQRELLGKPKNIYDDQGFYIYRNKRLIIWGSWLYMNVRREINKLARVRVDIPSELDFIWGLDVKKSSISIPDIIKEQLKISINDSLIRSKKEIKYPGKKEQEAEMPLWRRVELQGGVVKYELNRDDNPLYDQLISVLNGEQIILLNAYLNKVEEFIPKGLIISDGAESIKILNSQEEQNEEKLIEELIAYSEIADDPISAIEMLLKTQGYNKVEYRKP